MRIVITADAPSDTSPVSPIFGRCAYYAVYDSSTDKLDFVPNPAVGYARGAGIQAAQYVLSLGPEMIITGGIPGPNSSMVLSQAGIPVITNFVGSVRDAIEDAKSGKLKPQTAQSPIPPMAPGPFPGYQQVPLSKEDEIKMLEEEKEYIKRRLEEIKKRLKELKE